MKFHSQKGRIRSCLFVDAHTKDHYMTDTITTSRHCHYEIAQQETRFCTSYLGGDRCEEESDAIIIGDNERKQHFKTAILSSGESLSWQ
jgi:hypothetical protein